MEGGPREDFMSEIQSIGLHNHTNASDGFFAPSALIQQALEQGYGTLAITDHNTVHGWLGQDLPPNVVGGIEVSGICERTQTEVHLLGYNLHLTPELLAFSEAFYAFYQHTWQIALAQLGVAEVTQDLEIRSKQVTDLVAQGIATRQILNTWLRIQAQFRAENRAPRHLGCLEAVEFLHRAGATVSIAHPQRYPQAISEELLAQVDALEVYHPTHSAALTRFWYSVAERTGLRISGGHDFHGWNNPYFLPSPLILEDPRLLNLQHLCAPSPSP